MNTRFKIAVLSAFFLCLPFFAGAFEAQVGFNRASMDGFDCDENDCTAEPVFFPSIAVGIEMQKDIFLFLMADVLNYEIKSEFKGDEEFTVKVDSTSFTGFLVPRFETFDLRLGYGVVNESYDFTLDNKIKDQLASSGITNFKVDYEDSSGTQVVYGLDVKLSEMILIGVERRDLNIDVKGEITYDYLGTSYTEKLDDSDNNHSKTVFRLAISFSGK